MNTEPKNQPHPTENVFLFRTSSGMPILATASEFKKNWLSYIVDRGEAYTSELINEEAR